MKTRFIDSLPSFCVYSHLYFEGHVALDSRSMSPPSPDLASWHHSLPGIVCNKTGQSVMAQRNRRFGFRFVDGLSRHALRTYARFRLICPRAMSAPGSRKTQVVIFAFNPALVAGYHWLKAVR